MRKNAIDFIFETETKLIEEIISYMMKGTKKDIDIAKWKLKKIKEIGNVKKVSEKMIVENINQAVEIMQKQIRERGIESANIIDSRSKSNRLADALPVQADPRLYNILDRWEKKTRDEVFRLGAKMMAKVDDSVIDIIEGAGARLLSGNLTLRDAIKSTCQEWGRGFNLDLRDAAGRKWSSEGYSQMVLRSAIRQVTTDTQLERMAYLGDNLVEISSHLAARPLCRIYQGEVFQLKGSSEKYKNLYTDTSFGEAAGLFGINCRHDMYPYYETQGKTFEQHNMKEVEKAYNESQEQRYLERTVRNAKRNYAIETSTEGDVEKWKNKLENAENNLEKFFERTARTSRKDREEIYN
jgi:hypothetical protein